MPRQLPWDTEKPDSKDAVPPTAKAPASCSPKRALPKLEDEIPEDTSQLEGMRKEDEDWVMVEDEFLATAHLFTKSYHKAEYQKLSKQMSEKYAQPISKFQGSNRPGTSKPRDMMHKKRRLDDARRRKAEEKADEGPGYSKDLRAMMRPGQAKGVSLVGRVRLQSSENATWGGGESQISQSQYSQMLPPDLPPSRRPTHWRQQLQASQASQADETDDDFDLDDVGSSQAFPSGKAYAPPASRPAPSIARPPPTPPRPLPSSRLSATSSTSISTSSPSSYRQPAPSNSPSTNPSSSLTTSSTASYTPTAPPPAPPATTSPDPFDVFAAPKIKSKYCGRRITEK